MMWRLFTVLCACMPLTGWTQSSAPAPPSSVTVYAPPAQNGDTLRVVIGASPDDGGGNDDVIRYVVDRRKAGTATWERLADVPATDATTYELDDDGLDKGVRYYYRAAADNGLLSEYVTTSALTEDRLRPRPPGLQASDRPDDQGLVIILTITASPDDGAGANDVVLYRIQRRVSGGSYVFLRNVKASGQAQYVVTDRVDFKKRRYDYKVQAYDGTLYSAPVTASATARDNTKPRPPRNPRALDVPGDQGKALLVTFSRSLDDGVGANDVRRYRISRRVPGGSFVGVAVIRANGSDTYQYTDYGLTPGQSYVYRIVAWDGANVSDPVFATGKTADNRAPRPPGWLRVTDRPDDNGDALVLKFAASRDDGAYANDVKEYRIFRDPGPEGTKAMTLVAQVPATGAASYTYIDTGLVPNRKYDYAVRAYDGANLSDPASGSGTPLDNRAPGPPSNVTVADVPNDNGGAVVVSFSGSPDDGAGANDVKEYEVFRKRAGGQLAFLRTIAATDSQLYTFTDTGLVSGVYYVYRVRAYDGTQYSAAAYGRGQALDNTPPRPPTKFAVAPTPNAIGAADITFTASPDDTTAHPEVTEYEIYRKRAGTAWPATATLRVPATRKATYLVRDTGLTVGTTYYYKARAKAPTGFSRWTVWRKLVATDSRKPAPPRNLTAQDRPDDYGKAVIVRWTRSADDGANRKIVAKYVVFRKLTSVFESPASRVKVVPATGASTYEILDTSDELMNLRAYTYWAEAVSATGVRSNPSNEAQAVPRNDTILAPPTNLTAIDRPNSSNAIDLSWSRSASEGTVGPPPPPPFSVNRAASLAQITGDYEVFRRRVGQPWANTPYMVVSASVEGNPIRVTDTQATNGVQFEYKVRYRVSTAISPFSNTAVATAKDDRTSSAASQKPMVSILDCPAEVHSGEIIHIRVRVHTVGLSTVAVEWRVNDGPSRSSPPRTGRDSYEAAFDLMVGGLHPGDTVYLTARAASVQGTAESEEVEVRTVP